MKTGEEIDEEESEFLKEDRPRGSKNKEAEDPKKAAAGKVAPPKGKDAAKEEDKPEITPRKEIMATPADHTNTQIKEFLFHYRSERLIHIPCVKPNARKRGDTEKINLKGERGQDHEKAKEWIEKLTKDREEQAKDRE
jgi:hypothetical protein